MSPPFVPTLHFAALPASKHLFLASVLDWPAIDMLCWTAQVRWIHYPRQSPVRSACWQETAWPSSRCPNRSHPGKNHILAVVLWSSWGGSRSQRWKGAGRTLVSLAFCFGLSHGQQRFHADVKQVRGGHDGHSNLALMVVASSPVRRRGSMRKEAPSISPTPSSEGLTLLEFPLPG